MSANRLPSPSKGVLDIHPISGDLPSEIYTALDGMSFDEFHDYRQEKYPDSISIAASKTILDYVLKKGNYEFAANYVITILYSAKEIIHVFYNRLCEQGDVDKAIDLLKRVHAVNINIFYGQSHKLLVRAIFDSGDYQKLSFLFDMANINRDDVIKLLSEVASDAESSHSEYISFANFLKQNHPDFWQKFSKTNMKCATARFYGLATEQQVITAAISTEDREHIEYLKQQGFDVSQWLDYINHNNGGGYFGSDRFLDIMRDVYGLEFLEDMIQQTKIKNPESFSKPAFKKLSFYVQGRHIYDEMADHFQSSGLKIKMAFERKNTNISGSALILSAGVNETFYYFPLGLMIHIHGFDKTQVTIQNISEYLSAEEIEELKKTYDELQKEKKNPVEIEILPDEMGNHVAKETIENVTLTYLFHSNMINVGVGVGSGQNFRSFMLPALRLDVQGEMFYKALKRSVYGHGRATPKPNLLSLQNSS